MALTNKISQTITEFRGEVLARRGPQIAGMYEVILSQGVAPPITTYPLNVVLPGRMFTFYDHDIWGPIRKVPYKRGYTQCHMSFIIYQDWEERNYIESWMNSVLVNFGSGSASPTVQNVSEGFNDYINYEEVGRKGTINIKCISTQDKSKYNKEIVLQEAYPAAISQTSLASDGSGYATFTTTFQFNNYVYK